MTKFIISTPDRVGRNWYDEYYRHISAGLPVVCEPYYMIEPEHQPDYSQDTMTAINQRTTQINKIASQADMVTNRNRFILGTVDHHGNFSVSINPAVHDSVVAARTECARLSKLNPGKTYVFLQIAGGEFTPAVTTSF